jgi:hypothetical protein
LPTCEPRYFGVGRRALSKINSASSNWKKQTCVLAVLASST